MYQRILLERFYAKGKPHKRLSINVHLDGMRDTHDFVCDKPGVFDKAVEMIERGKQLGYSMYTTPRCSVNQHGRDRRDVRDADRAGSGRHHDFAGYHYQALEASRFLYRDEIHQKFKHVLKLSERYKISLTPLFLEFAAGERDYSCTPWGNVTRTPFGWKDPCYLIGKKYFKTWDEFWNGVDWTIGKTRRRLVSELSHALRL